MAVSTKVYAKGVLLGHLALAFIGVVIASLVSIVMWDIWILLAYVGIVLLFALASAGAALVWVVTIGPMVWVMVKLLERYGPDQRLSGDL